MINALRAEMRKLLTIRSTYIIIILTSLFVAFVATYAFGFRADDGGNNPNKIAESIIQIANSTGLIIAIVAMLAFTHEYRYNTINYTLTAARRRLSVLLAKIGVISVFAILFTTLISLIAVLGVLIGYELKGTDIVTQNIDILSVGWRVVVAAWMAGMIGLLLAALIRNQVGALVILILGPGTIEGILSLLLKSNSVYLPFTALNQITMNPGNAQVFGGGTPLSPAKAALVFLIYLVIGWAIAYWLFHRRDAN